MQLSEYKVRVKHKTKDAYRVAIVFAPGVYVAALWFKRYVRSEEMPLVLEKNGRRFDPRTGNRSYYRAIRLQIDAKRRRKEKRLDSVQTRELKKKDEKEQEKSHALFDHCSIVDENVFVPM